MSQPSAADRPVQELLTPKRTALGLRTNTRHSPALLTDIVERLRLLATARETRDARAEVEAALACRWWEIRIAAMKVIAAWGGALHKAWLIERAFRAQPECGHRSKEYAWWAAETSAAMRKVAPMLDDTDAGWALTLAHENVRAQVAFWKYMQDVPGDLFLAWLHAPMRESRGLLRLRLVNMVGQRKTLPGYMALMQAFANDDCEEVAVVARRWIAEVTSQTRKWARAACV